MVDIKVTGSTLPETYHSALFMLETLGEIIPCPDYGTNQKELSMTLEVQHPLREPMVSRLFPGGPESLEQYRQEILYGILDFEIAKGNWHYTYHDRMAAQIPLVVAELKKNPFSRRAVIDVRRIDDDWASDSPACLQNIQYFIRQNTLHCKVLFRSNDAVKAAFMNAFALIMLQKSVADELGVGIGSYTHRANSFHAYERDFVQLSVYAEAHAVKDFDDLTYCYAGDWDELMDEAKPEIERKVRELKARS